MVKYEGEMEVEVNNVIYNNVFYFDNNFMCQMWYQFYCINEKIEVEGGLGFKVCFFFGVLCFF